MILLRHADAGARGSHDDDAARPLSDLGRRQAKAVGARLADHGVRRILSSPAIRCVETVTPLAAELGLEIEILDALAEGSPPEPIVRLLADGDGIVVCSHGDVLTNLVGHLAAAGAPLDPTLSLPKGAALELVVNDRQVADARYAPPPV